MEPLSTPFPLRHQQRPPQRVPTVRITYITLIFYSRSGQPCAQPKGGLFSFYDAVTCIEMLKRIRNSLHIFDRDKLNHYVVGKPAPLLVSAPAEGSQLSATPSHTTSLSGSFPKKLTAYQHPSNLTGARPDFVQLGIPQQASDRVLIGVTVAPQALNSLQTHPGCTLCGI